MDGNEAAATVAYKTNEVIAIYPISPSTEMGEWCDLWASRRLTNIWGAVPLVQQMQSEAGVAGACHGALQTGSLATTFTASQGLLLMIPNMYKIAGELTPTVFHIAARAVATHSLSIFGDHSDVMAVRSTGWGVLFSNSPQESQDFALIAQAVTLQTRLPFLHAFDGYRTSHEIRKIRKLTDVEIRSMIDEGRVRAHRMRALSPEHPVIRGTAQNPDVYFQSREAVNPYYLAAPQIARETMERFAALTGRSYHLFDYTGAADAERILVLMGSGCEVAEETARFLNAHGEKVGVVKVRLYRPFSIKDFLSVLPVTTKALAVLDRTKEAGATGEPLYVDVVTALSEAWSNGKTSFKAPPKIVGGRYGLSSKDFTPAMVKAVLDELIKPQPKNHFTVGIVDDVTKTSLDVDPSFSAEPDDVVRALFWGLGSDGTVGANKNSIKIIGEETSNHVQGYFVFDSKKAGSVTVSHLRFGPRPIQSSYLIQHANFIGVHQFGFLEKYPILDAAQTGATLLINSPYQHREVWERLPLAVRHQIRSKKIKLYVTDAYRIAKETKLGVRINTIMQTGFFALSGVLPKEEAVKKIKEAVEKTYGKQGQAVVQKNFAAVDAALADLQSVSIPDAATTARELGPAVSCEAPEFVQKVTGEIIAGKGDRLPVSALPADGIYPTGTARWEKRNIAQEAPVWESDLCIQCGKCVLVCPHAVIRSKVYDPELLSHAPKTFKSIRAKWKEFEDKKYTLQIAVEDCTACALCVEICPVKDKADPSRKAVNMAPQLSLKEEERKNWDFFLSLPETSPFGGLRFDTVKNVQLLQPLFEFSGACAGCGETPYLKLLSQLFGDRTIIANATGCSSIYGGNLPTTPWTKNNRSRGPAWSNSLFEDNAEFGLGFRLSLDQQNKYAWSLVEKLQDAIGRPLAQAILHADQSDEAGIELQRKRLSDLKSRLTGNAEPLIKDLLAVADSLAKKSIWIVGGDGWAYDIGFGGLDHVLASGYNVNMLVLDTEIYSNTGGQASKATPKAAVAKFAAGGKSGRKKDLGQMVMAYGHVYVAQVAMGANDSQVIRAFIEAETYDGPSLIIAYSHCIEHGIEMSQGMRQQKMAVDSGYWTLYRRHPGLVKQGKNPFQLDSKQPVLPLKEYLYTENRYRLLQQKDPHEAEKLLEAAERDVWERWDAFEKMARNSGTPTRENVPKTQPARI